MWASFPVRGYIRRGSPALHRPLLMTTNYTTTSTTTTTIITIYTHNDHPRKCLPQVDQLTSMDQDKPLVVKYASLSPAHRRSFLRRVAIEPGEVSKSVQSDQWRATWQKRSFKLAPRCSLLALNLPSRIWVLTNTGAFMTRSANAMRRVYPPELAETTPTTMPPTSKTIPRCHLHLHSPPNLVTSSTKHGSYREK